MGSPSLYRQILGARYEELPEVLRRFHDHPAGGRAHGSFSVVRGRGRVRNGIAALLGFPKAGTDVPVTLHVVVEGGRERWVRSFDTVRLESVQWASGDLLMERIGPSSFSCRLVVDGHVLRYEFDRCWFLGVRLPRRLAPYVEGYVETDGPRWRSVVRIFAPLFGELVAYDGWVTPESPAKP